MNCTIILYFFSINYNNKFRRIVMSGSQQISLLRRSIFAMHSIAVAGVTYHYQENIFKRRLFDSLITTNTPKDIPICNKKTNKNLFPFPLMFWKRRYRQDFKCSKKNMMLKQHFLLQETGLKNILRLSKNAGCRS